MMGDEMIIESNQNPKLKYWFKLQQKKYRQQLQAFIVEGEHLVIEALASNAVKEILVRENAHGQLDKNIFAHQAVFVIKESLFNKLAMTETPQPVMAICELRSQGIENNNRLLLLDQIQDPGNLGTLIRSAVAFKFDGIVLGKGCVDLYNEKVIRSTQGAFFKIGIKQCSLLPYLHVLQSEGVKVIGTNLHNAMPLEKIPAYEKMAFILGNEGSGVNKELLESTDSNLFIEMSENVESLNVSIAGSIIMHHFRL